MFHDKTKSAGKVSSSNNKRESGKFEEETRKKHQYEDANFMKTRRMVAMGSM